MSFQDFINHSWKIHAQETEAVYQSLAQASEKMTNNDDIPLLARLITHICGDHLLKNWESGVQMLSALERHSLFKPQTESENAIKRSLAILKICGGQTVNTPNFSVSDQTRVYAQAAGIMIEHKDFVTGEKYLKTAVELAKNLDETNKNEPAFRALAITTNNVTCTLEEKADRGPAQTQFMIDTSVANLKYWVLGGDGAMDINMAEYRLANTYIQAGLYNVALGWAQKCFVGSIENKLGPFFEFYGAEMLCVAHYHLKNKTELDKYNTVFSDIYARLTDDEKKRAEKKYNKTRTLRL